MYEFWYDYVKLKYDEKAKLYYMDTARFILQIETGEIYKGTAEDVETKTMSHQRKTEIQKL